MYMNYFMFLVSLSFNDFYFFLNTILLLLVLWIFFFKLNTNLVKVTAKNNTNINVLKINSNNSFVFFYLYLICLKLFDTYLTHGVNSLVWFNHFNLNNFTLFVLYTFLFLSFFIFFLLKNVTKKTNLTKSIDYLFSLNNLILLLPYLFFVNTVFSFLFFLETISVVLFYKLVSSKIWFKNQNNSKSFNIGNNIPQNYINMIFFQYWITFFSTIFIVYFYINMFYLYGTTEWFIIQFLNIVDGVTIHTNNDLIRVTIIIFLLSVFFKLGLTPFHLFKVEVYKGLPYLSIFFYTTYYFSILFIYFLLLLLDNLFVFIPNFYLFLFILLFFGSIYIISLLFDVNFLKVFFTYSTIINTIGFLMVFISSL